MKLKEIRPTKQRQKRAKLIASVEANGAKENKTIPLNSLAKFITDPLEKDNGKMKFN